MDGEVAQFTYKIAEEKKQKRKRSYTIFDDDNDDMIDKAFRSRLVNKLAFSHRLSSEIDLFQPEMDNLSGIWREFKHVHRLEAQDNEEFMRCGDSAIKQYLHDCLGKVNACSERPESEAREIKFQVG
jgi:hypothetical protein